MERDPVEDFVIKKMSIEDYDELIKLWKSIEGMGLRSKDDSREGIGIFLKRNPNSCYVAIREEHLIGSILAGHDGRRGYLYHVAVSREMMKKGVGRSLVNHAIKALKDDGIKKVALVVYKGNEAGNRFWEHTGFLSREDLVYRDLPLDEDNF